MTVIDFDAAQRSRAARLAVKATLTGSSADDDHVQTAVDLFEAVRGRAPMPAPPPASSPPAPVPLDAARRWAEVRSSLAKIERAQSTCATRLALIRARLDDEQAPRDRDLRDLVRALRFLEKMRETTEDHESRCGMAAELLLGTVVELENGDVVDRAEIYGGDAA